MTTPSPAAIPQHPLDKRHELPAGSRYLSLPLVTSATRSELSGRCHRRHLLSDILQVEGAKSPSAGFGSHTHTFTQHWWLGTQINGWDHASAYMQASSQALQNFPETGLGGIHTPELLANMCGMYAKNATLAAGLPGSWDIVTLETRDLVEVDGVYVPFQLDRLLRNQDTGDLAQVDTKTSAEPGRKWKMDMSRSIQQRFYSWAVARYYNLPIHHLPFVVVEGLDKKGKATGHVGGVVNHWASMGWTDAYVDEAVAYVAHQAKRNQRFLEAVYLEASERDINADDHAAIRVAALRIVSRWPEFNYQDCHSYMSPCAYLGVCDATPEDRLGLLMGMGVDERMWHQHE